MTKPDLWRNKHWGNQTGSRFPSSWMLPGNQERRWYCIKSVTFKKPGEKVLFYHKSKVVFHWKLGSLVVLLYVKETVCREQAPATVQPLQMKPKWTENLNQRWRMCSGFWEERPSWLREAPSVSKVIELSKQLVCQIPELVSEIPEAHNRKGLREV